MAESSNWKSSIKRSDLAQDDLNKYCCHKIKLQNTFYINIIVFTYTLQSASVAESESPSVTFQTPNREHMCFSSFGSVTVFGFSFDSDKVISC